MPLEGNIAAAELLSLELAQLEDPTPVHNPHIPPLIDSEEHHISAVHEPADQLVLIATISKSKFTN